MTTKLITTMVAAAASSPQPWPRLWRRPTTSSAVAVISQMIRSNTTKLM